MSRRRNADCPGCGHPQPVAVVGTLAAHHDDGTPMPALGADFARMCPWSYSRPDADKPAAAAFVETARCTPSRPTPPPQPPPAPLDGQLDLLDLLSPPAGNPVTK